MNAKKMKKVNRQGLQYLYDIEVNEAKKKYENMVDNFDYSTEKERGDVVDAIEWQTSLNKSLDKADDAIDSFAKHFRLVENLNTLKSEDKKVRETAHEIMYPFLENINGNKRDRKMEKKIKKVLYENTRRIVEALYPNENIDLKNPSELARIWKNAKVQLRNDMTKFLNDFSDLQQIEKLILYNNFLQTDTVGKA